MLIFFGIMPFLSHSHLVSYEEMDLYKNWWSYIEHQAFASVNISGTLYSCLCNANIFKHGSYFVGFGCVTKNSLRQDFQMQSLPLHGAARTHVLIQTWHTSACGTEGLIKLTVPPIFCSAEIRQGAETEEFSIYSSSTASQLTARSAVVFSTLAQDILFVVDTHKIFYLPYAKGVNSSIFTLWFKV